MWLNYNNAGGIKCGNETYCSYESKEAGMEALERLLERYVLKYGYNIKEIRNVYCECGAQDYYDFMEVFNEELERLKNDI